MIHLYVDIFFINAMHGKCLQHTLQHTVVFKKNKKEKPLVKGSKLKDKCIYDNVDEYIDKSKTVSELDIFCEEFALFKIKNNIAVFREINENEWKSVDKYLLYYSLNIVFQKKEQKIIMEYGIIKGYVRLIDFYKNESQIESFKSEKEIMDYISCQGEDAIKLDMVFAILRDVVNTVGVSWW